MSSRSFVDLAYDLYANYWRDAKMSGDEQETTSGENAATGLNANHNAQGDCMYHAVYVAPEDAEGGLEEATTRVYQDKLEALKGMKKYKTGRLKTFHNYEEALDYARKGCEKEKEKEKEKYVPVVIIPANLEKVNYFKAPKPQELVAFRKLIECGDLEGVKNVAWENPRYLVGCGDTPAILQEGCRYNALHVITSKSQANAPQMCELILNTVRNPDFVKLLYGEEDVNYLDRAQILLDLYLNTPDKGLNETPLHFAAKYGLKDVVRVLVSYSECMRTARNKYGQTPEDAICSRRCRDEVLKKEIQQLLEDQYYVPVLRSEDNTLQPTIGDPFSPTSPPRPMKVDPISPRVEVRAFAGPMSKPQAFEFRRKWKTPPRMNLNLSRSNISLNDSFESLCSRQGDPSMRLQDTEKGLERVGRELAEECHVQWKEFWPFLNDFADLRCDEGLVQVEKYLEKRFQDICSKKNTETPKSAKTRDNDCLDELNNLCTKLESWTLNLNDNGCDSDSEEFYTPPSSPIPMALSPLKDSDTEEEMSSADEGSSTFIEGSEPTKIDFSVYSAIPSSIDKERYPFIYRWRHEMQLIIDSDNYDVLSTTMASTRRKLLATPEKPRKSKF